MTVILLTQMTNSDLQEYLRGIQREALAVQDKLTFIVDEIDSLLGAASKAEVPGHANEGTHESPYGMPLDEIQTRSMYLVSKVGNMASITNSLHRHAVTFMYDVPGCLEIINERDFHRFFGGVRKALSNILKFFWSMRKMFIK